MLDKHKIYKHINMTDVAFLVTEISNGFPDEYFVRGYWLRNTGLGNNMHEICHDIITIKSHDINNWELINEEKSHE